MASASQRPMSPHLQIWKWGAHMAVSITHRATAFILASAGLMLLVWWLMAISGGAESYALFQTWVVDAGEGTSEGGGGLAVAVNWLFRLVGLGLLWSFFQHMASGIRHLVLDVGAGYELKTNRTWSWATYFISITLTVLTVLFVVWRAMGA